jgi:hypothetical protein
MTPQQNIIFDELEQKAQGKVAALLGHLTRMEGAAELATALPKIIGPTVLLDTKKNLQRIWELFLNDPSSSHALHQVSSHALTLVRDRRSVTAGLGQILKGGQVRVLAGEPFANL